ncbi:hypothetical protein C7447_102246 [Tenacibaculum adriaticum]|uniref:Uncharacterized protein n=1 Tax=Tenacibaculum adriaticum TaxID=413713 RepID=A0A5S5DU85_9FLAO|nr:hypothetical protein C7447_102246 [Tenacibaculum adriaticum]
MFLNLLNWGTSITFASVSHEFKVALVPLLVALVVELIKLLIAYLKKKREAISIKEK